MVTQDDGTSPSSLTCHTRIPPLRLIPREVFPSLARAEVTARAVLTPIDRPKWAVLLSLEPWRSVPLSWY
jgi:hypothetical protein